MFLLPVTRIMRFCNPYQSCWLDLDTPLTLDEVTFILRAGSPRLCKTDFPLTRAGRRDIRLRHARKVAYFVQRGYEKPMQLDVGIPALGCHVEYFVTDGNHRLAADIYRLQVLGERCRSLVEVSGDINYAQRLGLWPKIRRRLTI